MYDTRRYCSFYDMYDKIQTTAEQKNPTTTNNEK
jgi:hypothetical protein